MLDYTQRNIKMVETFLSEHCPKIKPMHPEASFLIFLDNREMPFASAEEMHKFYLEKAHLYLNEGQTFGKDGEKFMRLNVALPRADLVSALHKLQQAYTEIGA